MTGLDPNDGPSWMRALQDSFPWTRDIPGIENDSNLPHVILGTIGLRFEDHVLASDERHASAGEWNQMLAWIEGNFPGGFDDATFVNNLVHVSFVEELVQWDPHKDAVVRLRLRAFPKLTAAYIAMDEYLKGGWKQGIQGQQSAK